MISEFAAWLVLPLVAGLQRFSVAYGYGGRDRAACRKAAWRLVALLYGIEALIWLLVGCVERPAWRGVHSCATRPGIEQHWEPGTCWDPYRPGVSIPPGAPL